MFGLHQTVGVGLTGLGGEVVQLVVENQAPLVDRRKRSERRVDGLRTDHDVAPAVHHAKMRRAGIVREIGQAVTFGLSRGFRTELRGKPSRIRL